MTDEQIAILAIERRFYRHASSKEQAVLEELGLTPIQYYMRLNKLIDNPEAIAAEPVLIARLRRIRDSRAKIRRVS